MEPIRVIKEMNSDWLLSDSVSNTKYRECPFENYSELPYYRHEIQSNEMLFTFKVETKETGYSIVSFNARALTEEYTYLKWEPKIIAFKEALPLLKRFLIFRFKAKHNNEEPSFENTVKIQRFAEEQLDSVKLSLSGLAHFQLSIIVEFYEAFAVDNIPAVKSEAQRLKEANSELPIETETLWYDFDEWLDENQIDYFKNELELLKQNWLIPETPINELYEKLYEPYISGQEILPDQDAYLAKHINLLQQYFRGMN